MFSLKTACLPPTAESLREALEVSLGELVRSPGGPRVQVEDQNYPRLSAIRVELDEASAGDRLPPIPELANGKIEPALEADQLEISARPLRIQNAPVQFYCQAQKVKIGQARDEAGNILLLLQNADAGKLELSIAMAELERLVRSTVTDLAGKQGIVLEDLRLQLKTRSERALDAEMRIRARKLFLNTQIRLTASLEIDDRLNARLFGIECAGEGTLGTLACGFLAPHLQRLNQREFSLLTLPLSEIRLRDLRVAVGDELRVNAEFGSAI